MSSLKSQVSTLNGMMDDSSHMMVANRTFLPFRLELPSMLLYCKWKEQRPAPSRKGKTMCSSISSLAALKCPPAIPGPALSERDVFAALWVYRHFIIMPVYNIYITGLEEAGAQRLGLCFLVFRNAVERAPLFIHTSQ